VTLGHSVKTNPLKGLHCNFFFPVTKWQKLAPVVLARGLIDEK